MKKLFVLLTGLAMLLFSSQKTEAQGGGFMFTAGVASFKMSDMKYLHEHILSTYPVEGKVTSSFPPFTSASITVFKQLYDYLRIGAGYSYSTTGAKSSYQDYSGEIFTEMKATSHRLGAYLSYTILDGDRLDLSLSGRLDANFTSMIIESYYSIYYYSDGVSNKYRSISPSGTIGAELFYKLKDIALGMEAGYLVDLRGNLKDADDGDPLLDPNDRDRVLTSDWSGWYVRLSVFINLRF
jgi:hypothetical protein